MPRRSKKSRAATQRNSQANSVVHINDCSRSIVPARIRGNFHQGDIQLFSAESAGRQCSCNALVFLCTIENIIDTLTPYHIDQVLQIGDQLYKTRCFELEAVNELHPGKILDQTQLPNTCRIDDCFYTIDYKHEKFRHGRLDDDPLQTELNTWLQYAFTVADKNILVLDGYMMAVYKQSMTGQFVYFDSHSRDENGLVAAEGTSIALIFGNFQDLLHYLLQLIASLRAKYFGIQPIVVHSSMKISAMNQKSSESNSTLISCATNQSEPTLNPEDTPGCSTWNDYCFRPSTNIRSPYTIWFNSLSEEKKKQRLQYMRTHKRCDYAIPEKRARKQVTSRNKEQINYANPEKRARKQKSSRRDYHADPEKKSAKIRNVIKNRCRQRRNITNVIETFQKRCREDQPIYACKICNRIEFRSQVIRLDPDNYDHSLLMKIMTEDIYCQLRGSDAWICKTCHDNIRKGNIPRIASVNKLGISETETARKVTLVTTQRRQKRLNKNMPKKCSKKYGIYYLMRQSNILHLQMC